LLRSMKLLNIMITPKIAVNNSAFITTPCPLRGEGVETFIY
jgi:hypothetical protein